MKLIFCALAAALLLAVPALGQETAPEDLPFEFIPKAFQGKWVLTKYEYPPIGPTEPTDPEYFIGKIIEIKNTSINFFGHVCKTSYVVLDYYKGDPRYTDFDKDQIPDADIKESYTFSMGLAVRCDSWLEPLPQGPEALFLGYQDDWADQYFRLYDPAAIFITTSMSNGPRYILRPIK